MPFNIRRVNKFLFNFDYQHLFRDIVKNVIRNGVYYCWYRESAKKNGTQKYSIQMMPQKYCKITGYWEGGVLYDIDLSFLLSGTVDLGLYSDIFGKYYEELFDPNSARKYVPSNQLNKRSGSWAYWVQTSPDEGAWCFKADTSTFASVPPLASLMRNTILDAEVQKLQYDKDFAGAYAILVGQMLMKKDSKQPNDFAIDPQTLGKLLSMVQAGLSKNIKVGAMPTEGHKFFQFEEHNKDMYTNQNLNTSALGASATRVIYTTDKCSEAEMIAQITTDAGEVKKLYYQFTNFLNFFSSFFGSGSCPIVLISLFLFRNDVLSQRTHQNLAFRLLPSPLNMRHNTCAYVSSNPNRVTHLYFPLQNDP